MLKFPYPGVLNHQPIVLVSAPSVRAQEVLEIGLRLNPASLLKPDILTLNFCEGDVDIQMVTQHQGQILIGRIPADPFVLWIVKQDVAIDVLLGDFSAVDRDPSVSFVQRRKEAGEILWSRLLLRRRFVHQEVCESRSGINHLLLDVRHWNVRTNLGPAFFAEIFGPLHVKDASHSIEEVARLTGNRICTELPFVMLNTSSDVGQGNALRIIKRAVWAFSLGERKSYFGIILSHSVSIPAVDLADPDHSEVIKFGRAQSAR